MLKLKQFIPAEFCLKCFGCCQFRENPTIWAPSKYKLITSSQGYVCPKLNLNNNYCKAYKVRPLDCQLYPFVLVKRDNVIYLGLHKSCSFIGESGIRPSGILEYTNYLKERLQNADIASYLSENPDIALNYQEDVEIITDLKDLYRKTHIHRLNKLNLNDKRLVNKYIKKSKVFLSAYNFCSIFIWNKLFDIFWAIIDGCLCIFYKDNIGMFMILPPLGEVNGSIIKKCFEIMAFYNHNSQVSRIENVSGSSLTAYRSSGFTPRQKDKEYICLRRDLYELKGDPFKSKRASCNYFSKNNKSAFIKYNDTMYNECVKLYEAWSIERKKDSQDEIYLQMLSDSFWSFKCALENYEKLGLLGYVVKVNDKIKACTFGYPINNDTFCILFEVCDLNLKGIAQFTFREFCRRIGKYKYINIMGASDLENLRKTKLSYKPIKEIEVYNIYPVSRSL